MTTFKENHSNSQETPDDAGGFLYHSNMRWVFNDGSILSNEVWNRYCK